MNFKKLWAAPAADRGVGKVLLITFPAETQSLNPPERQESLGILLPLHLSTWMPFEER